MNDFLDKDNTNINKKAWTVSKDFDTSLLVQALFAPPQEGLTIAPHRPADFDPQPHSEGESLWEGGLGTAGLRPQTRAQAGVAPSLRNDLVWPKISSSAGLPIHSWHHALTFA